MDIQGTTALVTGAAKRVGKSIAIDLALAGANIVVHYHESADQARACAEEIRSLGVSCELLGADLSEPGQIDELFGAVKANFGKLDILVNNAAVCKSTPLSSLTADLWDDQFSVNARAAALCISRASKLMPPGGAIVNIADVGAGIGWGGYSAYCASKAALVALTKSAAKALAPKIRVNAVSPGIVDWSDDISEVRKQTVIAHIPMNRAGSPKDIASAVVFLLQQDYITGQELRVDGGWHMA